MNSYSHDHEGLEPPAKKSRHDGDAAESDDDDVKPAAVKSNDGGGGEGCDGSSTTLLSFDALFVVMEFLHPKDLLNTAFTCKTLRDMVTTKLVVTSALIHGGLAKKSMEELHSLTSTHSIHVPSPLRLLRIANGKTCEFCLASKVNHLRPGTGLFACWDCLTNKHHSRYADHWGNSNSWTRCSLTKAWKQGWARYRRNHSRYDAIFQHPRVAANDYGRNYYMLSHHLTDLSGERVGAIVAWGDVDEMFTHFATVDAMNNGGINNYITNNLNAPSTEMYSEFNNTFAEMQHRAEAAVQEREEMKRARKEKTKENKIVKAQKMLDDLAALVDGNFREFAMKRALNQRFNSPDAKMSSTPCISIETHFIDGLLRPYIITPSKMKKKILKELAETINGKLRAITGKNLLAMDFLSDSDPFEAALKQYYRELLPNVEALFDVGKHRGFRNVPVNKIDEKFMDLLEADRLLGAISHLMKNENDMSPMLLTVEPSATRARDATDYDEANIKQLASTVWMDSLDKEEDKDTDARYGKAFAVSQAKFGEALDALNEYSAWLVEKYPSEEKEAELEFQRNNAAARWGRYSGEMIKKEFDKVEERQKCDWDWDRRNW